MVCRGGDCSCPLSVLFVWIVVQRPVKSINNLTGLCLKMQHTIFNMMFKISDTIRCQDVEKFKTVSSDFMSQILSVLTTMFISVKHVPFKIKYNCLGF